MTIRRILCTLLAFTACFIFTACGNTPSTAETTTQTTEAATTVSTTAEADDTTATTTATEVTTTGPLHDIDNMPRTIYGGAWETSHVQGIAIDTKREYMYFSFTTILVKTDLQGKIVGTVENLQGHLGDLDFNDEDGRVYGSLEFKSANTFYIAIFDVEKIDRIGINAMKSDIMTVVALPDVSADFTATVDGKLYRYGCSGIDGVAFGPVFGEEPGAPNQLMVAYGIFLDEGRHDNDHQVILQYDWRSFKDQEKPFNPQGTDTDGPAAAMRYFVYTGNTNYGVQNLEYDASSHLWLMAAYVGKKSQFPNFALFAVDGSIAPVMGDIVGQPTPEKGLLLTLADDGLNHQATGIRGWQFSHCDTGMIALDDGYFYISHDSKKDGKQSCTATLYRWVGGKFAFEKVNES